MRKRALLIGVNNYLHYKERSLDGCVNDINLMASVLKDKFGFDENNITLLKDEEATRDAIIKELTHILQTCTPNETIVFYFSGHGTRRISDDPDTTDHLEETIIPYDSGLTPHLDRDIRNTHLRDWIGLLIKKTSNIHFFFDCCHSGSMLRGPREQGFETKVRGFETDRTKSREITLPSVEAAAQSPNHQSPFPGSSANWLSLSDFYSLLTACRKDEVAREYLNEENDESIYYGAFTHFFVNELKRADPNSTYQDVFEQLRVKMPASLLVSQNPQIKGNSARQLFSDVETDTMKYVSVKERIQDNVILSAGRAQGLTINSEWAIYPSKSKYASAEDKLGSVKIIAVEAVTATAKIQDGEKSRQIEAGCRAVEEAHYYENRKKTVFIESHSTELKAVEQIVAESIQASSWVSLVDKKLEADLVVFLSVFLQADAISEIQADIFQADGTQALPQMIIRRKEDLPKIRQNLEKLSRYSMFLELENPSNNLEDKIEFVLLQQVNGEWREAAPAYNGLPQYVEDEQIAFRVTNKSDNHIYISILDLGLAKKISLLYPPNAESDRLGSTKAQSLNKPNPGILQVGVHPNESITLFVPETALLTEFSEINKRGAIEVFKLIATTEPTNFSWIEQTGVVTRAHFKSALEDLIYKYSSEQQTREAKIVLSPLNDWFTINCRFYLCKG